MLNKKYCIVNEGCNAFTGSFRKVMYYDNLLEAWNEYKRCKKYEFNYAGNDYGKYSKPRVIWVYRNQRTDGSHKQFLTRVEFEAHKKPLVETLEEEFPTIFSEEIII